MPSNSCETLFHSCQAKLKAVKKEHGSKVLGNVSVDMAIGGMRGIPVSV
jgi:hypothetical protein